MSNKPGRPTEFKQRDCIQVPIEAALKQALKTIAKREGKQLAQLYRDITKDPVESYVKAHLAGNKQFTLDLSSQPDFVALPTIGEAPPHPDKMKEKYDAQDLEIIVKRGEEWAKNAKSALDSSSRPDLPDVKPSGFTRQFCKFCNEVVVMPFGQDAHNQTHHREEWKRENPPKEQDDVVR